MFEIYIVIGFIVSGTFALRDLVFPKQAKADLEELASHGLSPGLIMFFVVILSKQGTFHKDQTVRTTEASLVDLMSRNPF